MMPDWTVYRVEAPGGTAPAPRNAIDVALVWRDKRLEAEALLEQVRQELKDCEHRVFTEAPGPEVPPTLTPLVARTCVACGRAMMVGGEERPPTPEQVAEREAAARAYAEDLELNARPT